MNITGKLLQIEHPAFKQAFVAFYLEMMIQTHKEKGLFKNTEKKEIIQIEELVQVVECSCR
jgi:hypothetical protein